MTELQELVQQLGAELDEHLYDNALGTWGEIAMLVQGLTAEAPAAPQWSREVPTEPGNYWHTGVGYTPAIVHLYENFGSVGIWWGNAGSFKPATELGGWWSGPLTPPAEPEPEEG